MRRQDEILAFIRSSFRSIWDLELLLHLKNQPWASVSKEEIVSELRASDTVVGNSVASLAAAGLIVQEQDGSIRYSPASDEIGSLIEETSMLYKVQPNAVRRIIVVGIDNLAAFADAFKLKKD